jgi:hypothetical protein
MTASGPDGGQHQGEAPGQLSPAVLDQLDGQLARRRADREAQRKRDQARGGPCSRCGTVESWERPGVGGWAGGDAHGPVCHACDRERGGPSGDDRQHRARAARLVLGQTPAPPWAGHGDTPAARWWHDDYLADAMVWWFEVPGARPGRGAERFAYLTGPELVARLYAGREPQPPTLEKGPKCPRCKARDRWLVTERSVSGQAYAIGDKISAGYIEIRRVCWGQEGACRYEPEPERRYNT